MIPPEDLCTAALLRSEERLSGTARTYLVTGVWLLVNIRSF